MLIFVYGTLKKEGSNHHILENGEAALIDHCTTIEKYPMFMLHDLFPYLQDKKGFGNIIKGELFEIPKSYENRLDWFEEVPTLYKKGTIDIKTDSGKIFNNVNCYFKAKDLSDTTLNNVSLIDEW